MAKPPEKLDRMYWSGYCEDTLHFVQSAPDDPDVRIAWLTGHLQDCTDCRRANEFKHYEMAVYVMLGVADQFDEGLDISQLAGYDVAMRAVLDGAEAEGFLTEDDVTWASERAERYGKPWPGRLH